jgi:hypothetical protein
MVGDAKLISRAPAGNGERGLDKRVIGGVLHAKETEERARIAQRRRINRVAQSGQRPRKQAVRTRDYLH